MTTIKQQTSKPLNRQPDVDISVIILNYKTKNLLKYCLKNLYAFFPKNIQMEIIVVDNNSSDGVGKFLRNKFPKIKFIQSEKNLGFAGGNNIGIRVAKGKYIAIINPDIFFISDAISKLYQFMEKNTDVAVSGPKLLNPDGSIQYSCFLEHNFLIPLYRRTPIGKFSFAKKKVHAYQMQDFLHDKIKKVFSLLGAFIFIRKKALDETGLFDENFFMYFEDIDLCRRFRKKNWKVVYFPEAEVIHFHQRTSADTPWFFGLFSKISREHIKSWLKYHWKWQKLFKHFNI